MLRSCMYVGPRKLGHKVAPSHQPRPVELPLFSQLYAYGKL